MPKWITNERIVWLTAVAWIVATLMSDNGPRWGSVIDVTAYPLGWSVCVKGHLQGGCYSVTKDVYRGCWVGAYWEDGHCTGRVDRPDSVPPARTATDYDHDQTAP